MAIKRNNEMDKNPLLNDKTEEEIITEEIQENQDSNIDVSAQTEKPIKGPLEEEEKTIYEKQEEEPYDVAGIFNPLLKKTFVGKKPKTLGERFEKQEELLTPSVDKDLYKVDTKTGKVVMVEPDASVLENIDKDMFGIFSGKDVENISPKFGKIGKDGNFEGDIEHFEKVMYKSYSKIIEKNKQKLTNNDIRKQSEKIGNWRAVQKLLTRQKDTPLDLQTTYKTNILLGQLLAHTETLAKRVQLLKDIPIEQLTKEQQKTLIEFKKAHITTGVIYSKVAGNNSTYGRGLQMLGQLPSAREADIADYLAKADPRDTKAIIQASGYFVELTDPYRKAALARNSIGGKWRDGVLTWFINSLLASPTTQMVNTAGNVMFNGMRWAEYQISAAYGVAARNLWGASSKDIMHFNRLSMLPAQAQEMFLDAFARGKVGFIRGHAASTKVDLPPSKINRDMLGKYKNTKLGYAVEGLNLLVTAPGRFLTTVDEMTKGAILRYELGRIANENFYATYHKALDDGISEIKAKKKGMAAHIETMENPPNDVIEEIKQSMLEGTFQGDLPESFNTLSAILNNPNVKFVVPFYKTIANIMFEAYKRTPGAFAMPSFYKAYKKGGKHRHLAITKMATGSLIMMGFGNMALNTTHPTFRITGKGPTDYSQRRLWLESGMQPYSFMIRDKKNPAKWIAISYARFEPLSAVIAMSVDIALLSSDPNVSEQSKLRYVTAATFAMYNYLEQQPFMGAATDFATILKGYGNDPGDLAERLTEFLGQKTGQVTSLVANPVGSLGRYLERRGDNEVYKKDYSMTQDQLESSRNFFSHIGLTEVPRGVQRFFYEWNKAANESPTFSVNPENIVYKTNFWNEKISWSIGRGPGNLVSIKEAKYSEMNDIMIKAGLGLPLPKNKFSGVKLSREQYQKYKKLYNNNNKELGFKYSFKDRIYNLVTGKPKSGLGKNPTFKMIDKLYKSGIIDNKTRQEKKQKEINKIFYEYSSKAKEMMIGIIHPITNKPIKEGTEPDLHKLMKEIRDKKEKTAPPIGLL